MGESMAGHFLRYVTLSEMVESLRAVVRPIGEEKLGILMIEVGIRSVQSGATIALYLDKGPVYITTTIGRWSINTFLRYTRKQIEQFSHTVFCKMLKFEAHRHVPAPQRVSHMDLR